MFGPSSLVCDIWPSSLCGVGEVEPNLRPDRDVVSVLGLGLPITESWGGSLSVCVVDVPCSGQELRQGMSFWPELQQRLLLLLSSIRGNPLSAYCTAGAAVQCTCYDTGDLLPGILS